MIDHAESEQMMTRPDLRWDQQGVPEMASHNSYWLVQIDAGLQCSKAADLQCSGVLLFSSSFRGLLDTLVVGDALGATFVLDSFPV